MRCRKVWSLWKEVLFFHFFFIFKFIFIFILLGIFFDTIYSVGYYWFGFDTFGGGSSNFLYEVGFLVNFLDLLIIYFASLKKIHIFC